MTTAIATLEARTTSASPADADGPTALLLAVRTDAWGNPHLVLAHVPAPAMDAAVAQAAGPVRIRTASGLGDLSREITLLVTRQLGPVAPVESPRAAMLARAKAYIEDNLTDDQLSPEAVARGIFISKRYLHVLFKDEGESVTRYIIGRRLAVGRERLRDPRNAHLSVADIASRLGFKDPSHFARAFKAQYTLTPSRFRRGDASRSQLHAVEREHDHDELLSAAS